MIDTTLKQWCPKCSAVTITRVCAIPPTLCCVGCCPPGNCRESYDDDDD